MLCVEEGLAVIHTSLALPFDELWVHAILYVVPIIYEEKANFEFEKARKILSVYIGSWTSTSATGGPGGGFELDNYITRLIKRAQKNLGRHDQSYFLGAYELLLNRKKINFLDLMAGKLLPGELKRVGRITRRTGLKLPDFILDYGGYMRKLEEISEANFVP